MYRFLEGIRTIGHLYPEQIKTQANPGTAFLDVQKSFSAAAVSINKAMADYEKHDKRKNTVKQG